MRLNKKSKKLFSCLVLFNFLLLAIISVFIIFYYIKLQKTKDYLLSRNIRNSIDNLLFNLGLNQTIFYETKKFYTVRKLEVGPDFQLDIFHKKIVETIKKNGGDLIHFKYGKNKIEYYFGFKNKVTYFLEIIKKIVPIKKYKIAIIIDDVSVYTMELLKEYLEFKGKLTFALFPKVKNVDLLSNLIRNKGFEIILHQPMEPEDYENRTIKLLNRTLLEKMDKNEIIKILNENISSVKGIKGMNNHQGSRFTKNSEKMKIVLSHLKKQNLFFIDSLTTPESKGYLLAKEIGLKAFKRDVFLDNKNDYYYIKNQFNKLIKIAKKKGFAIGIGHIFQSNTLKVLTENLANDEIEFVFVSELL